MIPARRILRWLAASMTLMAVLGVVAALLLRSDWFRQRLRDRMVRVIEAATGGRAEIGSFRFDARRMRISVNDFVLHGREAPGDPPLFRAPSLEVSLKLLSLVKPALDLRALKLARPAIHIIVFEDGSTNFPAPRVRPAPKGVVQRILDLAVDDFRIEDGRLLFQHRRIPIHVSAERFRTLWTFDSSGPNYDGSFSAARLETSLGGFPALPVRCQARLRLDAQRLQILSATLELEQSRLDVRGAIEQWAAPRASFQYAGRLRLEELRAALGAEDLPQRGDVRLDGRAELGSGEPWTAGRFDARGLLLERGGIRLAGVRAAADFNLRPDRLEWHNLRATLLSGRLAGHGTLAGWRDLNLEASLEDLSLRDLAAAAGYSSGPYQALVRGKLTLRGATNAGLEKWRIQTAIELAPGLEGEPLSGRIELDYDGRRSTLAVHRSHLATRSSHLELSGVAGEILHVSVHTSSWDDLERLRSVVPGLAREQIPAKITLTSADFRGAVRGPLSNLEIEGRLLGKGLSFEGVAFETAEAELEASARRLVLRRLRLTAPDLFATGSFTVGLDNWRAGRTSSFSAAVSLQSGDVAGLLARGGWKLPVAGEIEASLTASGTVAQPQAKARWVLVRGSAYEQDFERLTGEAAYRDRALTFRQIEARLGPGRIVLSGAYVHDERDFSRGRLRLQASAERLDAGSLRWLRQAAPEWRAVASAEFHSVIRVAPDGASLEALDGHARLDRVAWRDAALGALDLTASTDGSVLALELRGQLGGAEIQARSSVRLQDGYPAVGLLRFGRIQLADWLELLSVRDWQARRQPPLEIIAAGQLSFDLASIEKKLWKGTLELSEIELRPRTTPKAAAFSLRSPEPWIVELSAEEARMRKARLTGRNTELELTGSLRLSSREPFNLRCRGVFGLDALQELDPDLHTGGQLLLDAALRGPLDRPDLYGRVEVRNAFVNYADLPNGLDKVNGVLFLYRDRATIENLVAESGGGKVNLQGFVTFGESPGYWLQLRAADVRVRYPEGVSSTLNAALALTGNPAQSVLSGELTITRAAFHPQTDLGSMLVRSAQRPERPSHPLLENVRLDVRIRTAPQVRLETSLTRSLQAEADLRLRGTALRPALLGRALISQGEILFFGNRYSIESGEILFVNPARIEPLVNLHLQTRVRGVEVTLNINGPLNKTAVTYRSDPPLPFSDVVALLATGRAPSAAPGLSTARSEFAQSWEQAGAGALVSQAIASPLAGRLQRFLGVSRLKIDPTVRGIENTPEAHLTLEQQITPDVTLVYITNLARAQQQTIRLEWDFTRNFSALAVREANGLFGVDFLYKKRFK